MWDRLLASEAVVSVPGTMQVADLELDLEVFSGPFDLLLTLVLREEVDLMEVELADVVLAYIDVLEARGDLDLETATEFLVLVAALVYVGLAQAINVGRIATGRVLLRSAPGGAHR